MRIYNVIKQCLFYWPSGYIFMPYMVVIPEINTPTNTVVVQQMRADEA